MERIILFDGECNFCNKSVQFIIKRDPKRKFKFASLQSDIGKKLLSKYNYPSNINSFVLIENNVLFFKSSAALRVYKNLKGAWKLLYILFIVPKPFRDFFYEIIAKNRNKLFPSKNNCMLLNQEDTKRFLS